MEAVSRLEQTLLDLQKRFGQRAVLKLGEQGAVSHPPAIASGFPALDQLIGSGGIARGLVTAFCGQASVGRTTLVHRLIAQAQPEVSMAAYLDLAETFDGESAAGDGIDLERLLVVQRGQGELLPDLIGALVMLQVELIVLDASAAKQPVDLPEWLMTELACGGSALLLLHPFGQTPMSDQAAVRLLFERIAWLWSGGDITGCRTRVTVLASRFSAPGRQALLDLRLEGL